MLFRSFALSFHKIGYIRKNIQVNLMLFHSFALSFHKIGYIRKNIQVNLMLFHSFTLSLHYKSFFETIWAKNEDDYYRKTKRGMKAIVMGATSGIGKEVALNLAAKGWDVAIAGRRIEKLQEVVAMADGGIVGYKQIDINDEDAPAKLRSLIAEIGGMDVYFHSSGIGWQNNMLDMEKELATVETNGLGFTRMVGTAYNWFAENGCKGRIACISSIAGTKGLGAAPAYSATKRFQNHYLECLSQQARMRKLPIAITDIRPGFVATDLIAGKAYPLQLKAKDVAEDIVKAIDRGKEVKVVDWRYAVLVFLWRLMPRWMWVRMKIAK